uniref:F-box/LRR-repeat protein 15 n=1 Tax=Anthurium amnicola TaxID=1678845 RepID=A0A1D1XY69_9ARAE
MENLAEADGNNTDGSENMEVENLEDEGLHLELSLQRCPSTRPLMGAGELADGVCRVQCLPRGHTIGGPWLFEGYASSSSGSVCGQEAGMPVSLDPSWGKVDFFGLDREEIGRDFHKRAKVLHNYDILGCSLVPPESSMFLGYGLMPNNDCDEKLTIGEVADGNGNKASNTEDVELRMDLTEDLLHMVFSFLCHKDLCKAGAACKQWHMASAHEDFWKCLNFAGLNIVPDNFSAICHRYPNATQVNISGANLDLLVVEAMTSLRKLECLTLGEGQLPDGFFHALTDCPALKSLHINNASLGSGIQEMMVHHERLRDLEIIKCRALRISIRCPLLQTLSLKRGSMGHALLICPQLHLLDISSCHKLSDAGIRSAATSCPLLTSLDMSSCACVSDETLREIAFACPNLHYLDASFCPNISLESVRLPMLTDLKLRNCEGITSVSVAAISHCYMLGSLHLDCCALLTSVSLDLPHLQNISLVHCRKFVDLSLRSPVLSSVTVSNCPVLHRINITSNALQKLVLQKQESLATLSLQCHSLQEVDLTDCESLTNTICEVFSDGGGCPMLRSLVLDNCESLTLVGFNSSSLATLSLVGCRAMTVLELSCPNLQKVNLDGCDHLERALFCPVGLWSLNLGICPKLSMLKVEAPHMEGLELKGCGVLSEASINCPNLSSLDASFCSQLRDESLSSTAASCSLIESLILSSCTSIGSDALSSLHWLGRLTLLDLSYTFLTNLQPVFETCSQLKTLKLIACKYLSESSLDAVFKEGALPALCELDLSYSTVGKFAIEEILASCTNLINVNLNGCVNMHDLVWGSSGGASLKLSSNSSSWLMPVLNHGEYMQPGHLIESLNCVGCRNIRRVLIPQSACCFHLSHLNVSLAANLKEVYLSCPKLYYLNLSACGSLEILKLVCPRLAILYLTACSMLTEDAVEVAISNCYMLETLHVNNCPKIYSVNLRNLRIACPSLKRVYGGVWI